MSQLRNQRAALEDLEQHLLSSKRVREYLKQFSATQWPRVLKATLLFGIQAIEERIGSSSTLTVGVKDIEDAVVENEAKRAVQDDAKNAKVKPKVQQRVSKFNHTERQPLSQAKNMITQESYVITSPHGSNLELPQVNQLNKNNLKAELSNRRRDIYQQVENSKRSSSVPATAPSARYNGQQQIPKAAAGQKTPVVSNFQRNGSRPSNRMHYEVEMAKPRSRSLNPLIYPEWWGQDEVDESIEVSQSYQDDFYPAQQRAYHGAEDGWRKKVAHGYQESSLDRRLVEAKEAAAQLERMFAENNRVYQPPQQRVDSRPRHAHFEQVKIVNDEPNHPQYACRDDQPVGYVRYRSNGRVNSHSPSPVNHPQSRQQVNHVSYPSHVEADKENQKPSNRQKSKGSFLVQHSPPKHGYLKNTTKALTERPSTAAMPHQRDTSSRNITGTNNSNNVSRNISKPSQPHSSHTSQKQFHFASNPNNSKPSVHQRNSSNKALLPQPAYLKNVESRIKDRVMQDKMKGAQGDKRPEIYVKEKRPNIQQRQQKQAPIPLPNQNLNLKRPQYYENPSQAYQNRGGQNIAEIADGFLSSPLMTQFSSEQANQHYNHNHGFSNEVPHFIDSPSSHGEKPPTMTMHLSNVMQGGTNNPHYYNHNAGLSSVNTTSQNLCTTTNNTMMMGVVDRNNQNHNYYQPTEAYNNPMIIPNRNIIPHMPPENDESGFYSQNDFVMTNSNSNTPNSGGFNTGGTQKRGQHLPINQVNAQVYGHANYVREQAEDEDDEELSSAYMSKQYLNQGHTQGNTTNPFQTRKPDNNGDQTIGRDPNKLFSYNQAMRSNYTGAPQTPQLDNVNSGFHSSVVSNSFIQGETPFAQHYLNRQDQVQSPMSEDPNALSRRQKHYYNQHDVRSQNQQYEEERKVQQNQGSRPNINEHDVSTSSYNHPHTEDYRKMFAKTPAGRQEQKQRDTSTSDLTSAIGVTDRQVLANITPNQSYFNKKTTFVQVKSTNENQKYGETPNDLVASPSTHSQGVALKPMIGKSQVSTKSPKIVNGLNYQHPLKSQNVHRVSVSSSNSSSEDDDSDDEESDPNRTGETSNISEGSSYFTNQLSQSEGGAESRKQSQMHHNNGGSSTSGIPIQGQFSFHNQHQKSGGGAQMMQLQQKMY